MSSTCASINPDRPAPLPPARPGVPDTWDNLYSFFINRVRDRLHMVLCFSPVGKKFARWAQQVVGWGAGGGGVAGWNVHRRGKRTGPHML